MKAEVKTMQKYRQPQYPAIETVRLHPELLRKLPERWRGSAVLCIALALSAGLTGCEAKDKVRCFVHGPGKSAYRDLGSNAQWTGEGNFPQYLSESDALVIIREEVEARRLAMDDKLITLDHELEIPTTGPNPMETLKWDVCFKVDGYNADKKIAYEYVSDADIQAWLKVLPKNGTYQP